jgi:uncharacterized Zn-binding protein involved in type VI secretion
MKSGRLDMSRPFIVIGDKTSHGGTVISGTPFSVVDGKAIARVGDKVTCPHKGHGGTTVIVTGDKTKIIDGQPVACHGDKTACGATLISSQIMTYVDGGSSNMSAGSGGVSSGTTSGALTALSSVVAALSSDDAQDLVIYYEIVDAQTEVPIEGMTYKLLSGDDVLVSDETLSDGKTQTFPAKDHPNLTLIAWQAGGVR